MDIEINYVSELPLEKLQEILNKGANIEKISITSEVNHVVRYSVDDYKKIYQKLEELIDGINPNWSQQKKFVMIYKRMTENIEYDHIAAYPNKMNIKEKVYSKQEKINCRSLKNGLLYGKCVCQGYSEIMRNACSLLGVKAIEIVDNSHSWNQILIEDGKWIEIDATWGCRNQIQYIGSNKEAFWKEHGRDYKSIFEDENKVENFDLVKFINSEFELDATWYTKEEEKKFIDLMEKRDIYKQDVNEELNILMLKINKRKEFEKECGYTIQELLEYGFIEESIEMMQFKFDEFLGIKINRKELVEKMLQEKNKKRQEFEQKCGYTLEELRKLGFTKEEIEDLQYNYSLITEERIESSEIINKRVKLMKSSDGKLNMYEKTQKIQYLATDLHPEIVKKIKQYMIDGKITFEEAIEIIKYKQGKGKVEDIKKIEKNVQKRMKQKEEQEFERECGYTIERLIELGFSKKEIDELQCKYDPIMGKKLNRKKIVAIRIKQKKRNSKNTVNRYLYNINKDNMDKYKESESSKLKEKESLHKKINEGINEDKKQLGWILSSDEKEAIEKANIYFAKKHKKKEKDNSRNIKSNQDYENR